MTHKSEEELYDSEPSYEEFSQDSDRMVALAKDRAELFWFCVMAAVVLVAVELIL